MVKGKNNRNIQDTCSEASRRKSPCRSGESPSHSTTLGALPHGRAHLSLRCTQEYSSWYNYWYKEVKAPNPTKKNKIAASKQLVISQWLFNSRWSTRSPTFIVTKKLTDTNQRTCPQLSFFHSSRFSESTCSIIVGMEDSFCRLCQAACISCSWIWFAIQNLDRVVHYHLVLDNQVIERMAMFHQCQVVRLWLEHRILYKAHVVWWHSQHRAHRLHSFHE